ncbi:hypothetical protein [Streptomyces litmocidini]|uniref:Uncharacterized protein n=1 Tax=Streptomyces litmocidini TaxID=67318 RepID=A0ABW7U842_9ACTN
MGHEYHGGTTRVRRPVPGRAAAYGLADATATSFAAVDELVPADPEQRRQRRQAA